MKKRMGKEMVLGETHYIIYGSDAALRMYEESVDSLITSNKYDFDVVRCTPNNPITTLLDDFVPFERFLFIDEQTYKLLHENLCQKIHKLVGLPIYDLRLGLK
ncbi:hypothetical protein N9954_07985 [Maribacter sp.]|nr:hypothetical protein [Maribacter sp.]